MGSAVAFVYAVSRAELVSVPGSRQQEIIDTIASDYWQLDNVAEALKDDELPIDLTGAVTQIVYGEDLAPALGSLYLYAVEAICWYLGSTLVLPVSFCGEECIDTVLAAQGSLLRVTDLVLSGSPIPIPPAGCPPSIGWWTPEAIAAGSPLITALTLNGVDRGTLEGLKEVRRWIAEAESISDGCLVGTYY